MDVRFAMHAAAAAVVGLACAGPAHAIAWFDTPTRTSSALVAVNYTQGDESGSESASRRSAVGNGVRASEAVGPLSAEAYAKVDGGHLASSASTRFDPAWRYSGSSFYDRTVSAQSSAIWVDHITITGGTGLSTAEFASVVEGRLDGGREQSGAGSGAGVFFSAVYESPYCFWWYDCNAADLDQTLAYVDRDLGPRAKLGMRDEMTNAFTFEYGQTFQLRVTLSTNAFEGGDADFASTAAFGFILPEGAVLQSALGYDYGAASAPVPEPATYALTATGLALLGLARRAANRRGGRRR